MSSVASELIERIKELQSLPSLSNFPLIGGTNLALRFNHRVSIDIDLITNKVIGENGFSDISKDIQDFYGKSILRIEMINVDVGDQYIFLRTFISKGNSTIKVEVLQNIQYLNDHEEIEGINMLSLTDIGLLKLEAATKRFANKDIYDLDFLTDKYSLDELFSLQKAKIIKYKSDQYKSLFDLDGDKFNPDTNLGLLLKFDSYDVKSSRKPWHSNDRIDIISGNKSFKDACRSWSWKIRKYCMSNGIDYKTIKVRRL
jgi:hypothetical protein